MSRTQVVKTEPPEFASTGTVLPASFAQQRMWFLERFEGGAVYNVPVATRLRGRLNIEALDRALGALIERHESLRTVFTLVEGVPHQVIRPAGPFALEVIDLSGNRGGEERALEIASRQARSRFDLASEAPLRVVLLKLDEEDHVLSLTLHHIVTDAWSMGVLNRELGELYTGFCTGEPARLPELKIQYADYAVWQQEWIERGGLDGQIDYWRNQLSGAPPLLELPTDRPRPSRQSFRGATKRVTLPRPLLEQARDLSEREGATMFMTLLAAFTVLLSRYSGQEDVVVVSPVANRGRTELERIIGLFVNTLPLRVDLTGDPSFRELLQRVREVALDAYSNQDLPFEKLVEKLAPERHLNHTPVAQVMFVLQNAAERPTSFPGIAHERLLTERGTAKFDLTLFAAETPDGLRVSLEYCTDLFEETTALRMLEQYGVLLEAALDNPARPVSHLQLLNKAEEGLVLGEWNETTRGYPPDRARPVHELYAQQSRRTPDALAVTFEGAQLTYAELEARANQLASHLLGLGIRPGTVVAICLDRSIEMVVAVLAVLKAGGAYAPIDPNYPEERIAFMLEDTNAPVMLTQQHLLARVPAHNARTVCFDVDWEEIAAHDGQPVDGGATLDDLAYVLYTSGSTGRPKGVAMGHRALTNLLAWQLESWATADAPPARTMQFASLSFDVAFQELFSTWCSGGTLMLIGDELRRDPGALLAFIRERQVERLFLPFVALHTLCEAAGYLRVSETTLREVITAGEQLKVTAPIRDFFDRNPDCTLVNQYGPTESHVVTAFQLNGPANEWPTLPPIGRPIANAKVYLLDRHRQPVPVGVPGELCIGGVSLAEGYLGREDLTAERFSADPFSSDVTARLYRTGDLARYGPSGDIHFLGRVDHQVKIRGYRIEPGEVEAALREHPAVRDALVIVREDGGEKRLAAYVIGETTSLDGDQVRDFLRRTLPDYMVPSAFAVLDAFPLTPNGKVDRAQLAGMALSASERTLTPPRTETERLLSVIWKNVLDIEEIGVHDNFFELGGHSLMAVRLFAEIERKLGARLPLSALFETATIAGIAEAIEQDRGKDVAWSSLISLRPGEAQPLFLIGWAGGEVLPYRDLVENLGPDLPVFGLRAPGVDRREIPLGTVEELAAFYVEEVQRAQPHGPYRLGGFCFSGLVAYEMARQLQAGGETTSTLALIDAYPYRPQRRRGLLKAGSTQLRAFTEGGTDRREWVRNRVAGVEGRFHRAVYLKVGPRLFELLAARRLQRMIPRRPWNLVLIASNLARRRYVPKPLDVRVAFFRAQRAPDAGPTPWDGLATRGVDLREIVAPEITHDGMMHEPHVQMLAEHLMRVLADETRPPAE